MTVMHTRRHHPISLEQASREAPELLRLLRRAHQSKQRLAEIAHLLPDGLREQVQAGPLEGHEAEHWCLLVRNASAAAKLRHLLPTLKAHLLMGGWEVESIRLRVLGQSREY